MALEDIWGNEVAQGYNNLAKSDESIADLYPNMLKTQGIADQNQETQARTAQTEAQTADTTAMSPLRQASAALGLKNEELTYAQAQQKAQEATRGFYERQLADTVKGIDPADPDYAQKWDAAMSSLDSQGNPLAKQYIGHATANAPSQVAALYGGYGAGSTLSAITGAQRFAPGADQPVMGAAPAVTAEQIQAMPDAQFSALADHAMAYDTAIEAVERAKPSERSATWDAQIARMAADPSLMPAMRQRLAGLVGQYTPALFERLKQEEQPQISAVLTEAQRRQENLPKAPLPSKTETSPGGGVTMQVQQPDGTWKATRILDGNQWSLIGTDPSTGMGIYHNNETNQEARGTMALGAKPGTTKTFSADDKKAMWLQAHPGDTQGALEYAAGKTQMSPGAAMGAAYIRAEQENAQAALVGKAMTPDQIDARAKQIQGDILAAQSAPGAPATPSPTPTPAPTPTPNAPPPGGWPKPVVAGIDLLKSRLAAKGANVKQERALFDAKFGPGASRQYVPRDPGQ